MHFPVPVEFLALLIIGLPLVLVAHRLGISTIIAYMTAGAVATATGMISFETIFETAEIGAALLLFALGLELDLIAVRQRWRQLLIGATCQIGLTIGVGTLAMMALGFDWPTAFTIGACLSVSSTLLVLRALDECKLRNRDEGKMVVGLLLSQDMALAPLLVVLSVVLPSKVEDAHSTPWWYLPAGAIIILSLTALLRLVLASPLLKRIRATKQSELEVAFALITALGAAWLSSSMGLGMAIGAFCAGLALGDDEHRHAIETSMRPLTGLLAIFFFMSMGMLLDLDYLAANALVVLVALLVSIVVKAALAGFALRLAGLSIPSAIGCGIMVGQVGEFSYVLASFAYGGGQGGLDEEIYRLIVAVSCLSLAATPFLVMAANRFLPRSSLAEITETDETFVVAGLGPVGNTVVETLHNAGQRIFLVDRNQKLLDAWTDTPDVRAHLGRIEDMEDWLPVLGKRPRVVILTFPIADTSALVAGRLRQMDPSLVVVARTPFQSQVRMLHDAGVQYVICDETETAQALIPVIEEALGRRRRTPLVGKPSRVFTAITHEKSDSSAP